MEYPLRILGRRIRRLPGIGLHVCCAVFLAAIGLIPADGYGQVLFGDPSSTLGGLGKFRLEAGRVVIDSQQLKFEGKIFSVEKPAQRFDLIAPETTDVINSEQSFLTATVGLGRIGDIFLTAGKFRITGLFDGSYGPAGGIGFRVSPPQTGLLKVGLLLQAFYATTENNGFDTHVDTWSQPNSSGVQYHVVASGRSEDKLKLIAYNVLLGVGFQNLPYVRPYAGLFLSSLNRNEKGSFSGQGVLTTCSRGICRPGPSPLSLSWNTNVFTDTIIGGVLGLTITPIEWIGVNIEGHLGGGKLGNERGFMASALINF